MAALKDSLVRITRRSCGTLRRDAARAPQLER